MKPVDYSRIAPTYDALAIRNDVPPDPLLEARMRAAPQPGGAREPVRVLDVGCGTGTYLAAQARAFGARVALTGVDPSAAMLERAAPKLAASGATLVVGDAESLPFPGGAFDVVVSRFAFHHFEDKPRALRELARVLAPGGSIAVTNVAPEHMPGFWAFTCFPEARAMNARYWELERLCRELAALGLEVTHTLRVARRSLPLAEALVQAETRDQSHLFAIEDDAYAQGLAALRARVARDPDGVLADESAVGCVTATRTLA